MSTKRSQPTRRIAFPQRAVRIGALVIIGGGVLAFVFVWQSSGGTNRVSTIASDDAPAPTADRVHRWIDGTPLTAGELQPLASALIIDNAPESRPQSGLVDAPLVFEVPVEGRRTRFLAIVPVDGGARVAGPVRSARPYFVKLAQSIGVPLVHVGGSAAAMALLRSGAWLHIDQYFDPPFWRDPARPAPFNVYTAASNLGSFVRMRGWEERLRVGVADLWTYTEDASPNPGDNVFLSFEISNLKSLEGEAVHLSFDSGQYMVQWTYDAQAGVYKRLQGGYPHLIRASAEERAVTARNVVALRVRSRVLDAIGRLEIAALESPQQAPAVPLAAAVYSGGRRTNGTWAWNIGGSPRFQLLQSDGTPIALRPGTTWVEFVDFDSPFLRHSEER